MQICSLLPSATEILYALELGDCVAGVTHECDYPLEARGKPVVVHSRVDPLLPPAEVDRQVTAFLARGESIYSVDGEKLRSIGPDLVLTQDLCHVCAASPGDLAAALNKLPRAPRVLSLSPRTLADVWADIRRVGEATGRVSQGQALAAALERRMEVVQSVVADAPRPRVAFLEWLDPPYNAGHWVPEMIELAGGTDVLGRAGEPSVRIEWRQVQAAQPEIVLVAPCGYGAERAVEEFRRTKLPAGWDDLPAVREGKVFALEANSYFSRPGPRLASGVEILARLFHAERANWQIPAGAVRSLQRVTSAQR